LTLFKHFLRNTGTTPAYNINLGIEPSITIRNKISSELNIFRKPIPVLGAKEEISFFFDSAIELFNKENHLTEFSVHLKYHNNENENYEETISIDIELFKDLALELPASDKLIEILDKTQKDLEKISRYIERLQTKEMLQEWQKDQEKDDEGK
jgi:hypothetical protein